MADAGAFEYFICGGFGGICTVITGHPFDTIKVRLQTMAAPVAGTTPLYRGTFDCLQKTVVKEGFTGLYKGMGAPLVGIAPIFAISFMGYRVGKEVVAPKDGSRLHYGHYFTAGAFSGIFTTAIMAPGERIKCLLQVQHGEAVKLYSGPIDCVKQLYREGGLRSVYRGAAATLLRDVPASGLYFLTYEALKDYFTENGKKELGLGHTLFAGGCAGIANWLIGMPFDVVKSRLQTAPHGMYKDGIREVARELFRKEGPTAFYKGFVPVLLRAFPANAACFLGFEFARKMMNRLKPQPETPVSALEEKVAS